MTRAGDVTIDLATISGNTATYGGGISHNQGNLTITSSTISGNNAVQGGGILSETSPGYSTKITNSTISANTASTLGGGVFNGLGAMEIRHSTITNNESDAIPGGGIVSRFESTTTLVYSSIIAGNPLGSDV